MSIWSERQAEVANLLNPAFCGFLLREAVSSYVSEAGEGMPLSLCFLVLPFVLHSPTREALPSSIRTTLLAWLQANPEVRLEFAFRVRSITPFTREALRFLIIRELISTDGGILRVGTGNLNNARGLQTRITSATEEIADCVVRARFLGRWLALAPDEVTVYNFLGVQP